MNQFADWCIVFFELCGWTEPVEEWSPRSRFCQGWAPGARRLAESGAPRFELYPTRTVVLDEARVPASLLASYALMFLWDVVEGRRALRCKNCDHYFVSDEHHAAYCSKRCRNTEQSRRYRAKKEVG